jgi:hypothetical protein
MVKDLRTGVERSDQQKVLDGDLDEFMARHSPRGWAMGGTRKRRKMRAANMSRFEKLIALAKA